MAFFRDNNSWPHRFILIIGDTKTSFDAELIDRLKRRKWEILQVAGNVEEAIAALPDRSLSMILIDDTDRLPSPYVMRNLLTDPLIYMIPVIALVDEKNAKEKACFSSLFSVEVVDKPLIPAKFVDTFEWSVQRWSSGFMKELREACGEFKSGNRQTCIRILTRLAAVPESSAIAAGCLSAMLLQNNDYKTAEKILISALRPSSRNLGLILPLAQLYLRNAMPDLALKLLKSVSASYGSPRMLAFDNIQAHLMLGQITECIPFLQDMVNGNYMVDTLQPILWKFLYADGHERRFAEALRINRVTATQIVEVWGKHQLSLSSRAS